MNIISCVTHHVYSFREIALHILWSWFFGLFVFSLSSDTPLYIFWIRVIYEVYDCQYFLTFCRLYWLYYLQHTNFKILVKFSSFKHSFVICAFRVMCKLRGYSESTYFVLGIMQNGKDEWVQELATFLSSYDKLPWFHYMWEDVLSQGAECPWNHSDLRWIDPLSY